MIRATTRRAVARDLPAVTLLESECFADPWSADSFESMLDAPHVHFLVADAGATGAEKIGGYVILLMLGGEAEILNVAVSQEFRRAGIGSLLLKAALERSAKFGVETHFLEVREGNVAARTLYARHGFVEVGVRKSYYRNPVESALVLRRESAPM